MKSPGAEEVWGGNDDARSDGSPRRTHVTFGGEFAEREIRQLGYSFTALPHANGGRGGRQLTLDLAPMNWTPGSSLISLLQPTTLEEEAGLTGSIARRDTHAKLCGNMITVGGGSGPQAVCFCPTK